MARDGYRIFDSDTHVGPDAAILDRYLSAAEKGRLALWEPYRSTGGNGRVTYNKGQRHYRRKLGTAKPDETPAGYMPASPASRASASPRRRSMPTRPPASPTWITRASTPT